MSCSVTLHVGIGLVDQKVFTERTTGFMKATKFEAEKDVNPGGYYKAIWARDAAFILKDQFLSGHFKSTLDRLLLIWSNQIGREVSPSLLFYNNFKRKPLLYGRGSPELDFKSIIANDDKINEFEGALPTTIYYERGFCEIYGQNPDIDSTALMIYVTSWILNKLMTLKENNKDIDANVRLIKHGKNDKEEKSLLLAVSTSEAINFLIPRMLRAITYLQSRDLDNDGLLEQKHNEDWMDTLLRTGKVVYSQACWILALKNMAVLLRKLGNETESRRLEEISNRTISAVEEKMWSSNDKCYIDQLEADDHLDVEMHNRLVTQDISLYLVALTECDGDRFSPLYNTQQIGVIAPKTHIDYNNTEMYERALDTLLALKNRIWKNNLPLVTEKEVTKTGPWRLEPNEYHNHTFWAWITGIEMIARNRFGKIDDFNHLLSLFVSKNGINSNMLHEWVNPLTFKGNGAFPFRTGFSALRIAISESIAKTGCENIIE